MKSRSPIRKRTKERRKAIWKQIEELKEGDPTAEARDRASSPCHSESAITASRKSSRLAVTPKRKALWKQIEDKKCNVSGAKENLKTMDSNYAVKDAKPHTSKKRKWIRKISSKWKNRPAVKIFKDNREMCNPLTPEGRAEYKWRTLLMWVRQDGWCCFRDYDFCPGRLKLNAATFQHEALRGKSRDDRLWNPETRKPINGAAHGTCNGIASSRRLEIYHGNNMVMEIER